MSHRYAIVTPVKNEEQVFGKMIYSVVNQTITPQRWVIIDDGSTDGTGEMIREAISRYDWITGIHNEDQKMKRKPGGESVLPLGLRLLNSENYDFLARLDGDLSFDSDYFQNLFREFEKDPALGIAGGVCYVMDRGKLVEEKHPRFHVRGATKTYRSRCFREIGGLETCLGWDTVDEVKANMLGWRTRSFPQLRVIHHRKTQTAEGALKGMKNGGRAAYFAGYHPVFMFVRTLKKMLQPPYVIGGAVMFATFCESYATHRSQIRDPQLIEYLRRQQINRLIGKETIWK